MRIGGAWLILVKNSVYNSGDLFRAMQFVLESYFVSPAQNINQIFNIVSITAILL
jgi:hypothetical protein